MRLGSLSDVPLFLQSRIARRVAVLFVVCALLPLGGLAYFGTRLAKDRFLSLGHHELHNAAKTTGLAIFDRLEMLENSVLLATPRHPRVGSAPLPRIGILSAREEAGAVPLSSSADTHGRRSALQAVVAPGRAAHLFLRTERSADGFALAELDPEYVFRYLSDVSSTGVTVLDSTGAVLFSSRPQEIPSAGFRDLLSGAGGSSGRLSWSTDGKRLLAARWKLFMQPRFGTDWTVVYSRPEAELLEPVRTFKRLFLLSAAVTFGLAILFSVAQIRRSLTPIEVLGAATRRMGSLDYSTRVAIRSGDEFEDLAVSFNDMAEGLERHAWSMDTLSRIGMALSAEQDLGKLLGEILHSARSLTRADRAELRLRQGERVLELAAVSTAGALDGHPSKSAPHVPYPGEDEAGGAPPLALRSILEAGTVSEWLEATGSGNASGEPTSALAVPLRDAEHQILGALWLGNARDLRSGRVVEFRDEERAVAETLASQAGLAISNTRLNEALRENERRYRELVENNPGPICLHDLSGKIEYVNDAWASLLEYSVPEIVGRQLIDFLNPEDVVMFQEHLLDTLRGETSQAALRFATKTKKERIWTYQSSQYQPADRAAYVIGHAQDYTDRDALEKQLRHTQKMQAIGTLAGGIAHDFNNILTAVMCSAELALLQVPEESPVKPRLDQVLSAADRAKELVRQILTFSRQAEPGRTPLALASLVKEAMKLVRSTFPSSVEVEVDLGASPRVEADPTQLHQVLLNLCTNAEHAMRPDGGVLQVRLDSVLVEGDGAGSPAGLRPGRHALLTVKDSGKGMEPETAARVFEPFFTTKPVGEGTGMGLSISHGIVTSHGGTVEVESKPGAGTTFRVYLPEIEGAEAIADSTEEKLPSGAGQRILVVDDDEQLGALAADTLTSLGYDPVLTRGSAEALQLFTGDPQGYQLVVTDQTMPHMSGVALAQKMRELRSDIPIILCSGFSHSVDPGKVLPEGIDGFCQKPWTRADMARLIDEVLSRSPCGEGRPA